MVSTSMRITIAVGTTGDSMDRILVRLLEIVVATTLIVLMVSMTVSSTLRGDVGHSLSVLHS